MVAAHVPAAYLYTLVADEELPYICLDCEVPVGKTKLFL